MTTATLVPPPTFGPTCDERHFPSVPASVGAARDWIRNLVPGHHDLLLCVSEAVTNAIIHPDPETADGVTVGVRITATEVSVVVTDSGGATFPCIPGAQDPYSQHGRGIAMIDTMADAWGLIRTKNRATKVWFTFTCLDA